MLEKELRELNLRDTLRISIIGITESSGAFVQLPNGDKVINKNSKLLIVGSQKRSFKSKKSIKFNKSTKGIIIMFTILPIKGYIDQIDGFFVMEFMLDLNQMEIMI